MGTKGVKCLYKRKVPKSSMSRIGGVKVIQDATSGKNYFLQGHIFISLLGSRKKLI